MKILSSKDPEFLEFVGKQESQYIMDKSHWRDEVKDYFDGDVHVVGDFLPWSKTDNIIRLRPGEVSIWAGINGHYKSTVTGMVALWLSKVTNVLIASLEMKPAATLQRMVRQASGGNNPAQGYIDKFFSWDNGMWIYDQLDSVETDRIIGMLHYAASKLKIKHAFIDSFMKLGVGTDDYNRQKEVIDRLCWLAKAENIHVHLIHHMRKGKSESDRPGKFDVKGAGELVDMVDNLLICWVNKPLMEKRRLAKVGVEVEVDEDDADMILTVAKQRHGEWEGGIKLWFHPSSQQFVPTKHLKPMPFEFS